MKKKILLILLVLSLTVSVLAACGGDENPSAQEGGTTAEQESSALAEPILPDLDYDFASVTIHIRNDDETIKEIGLDQTGEALSSELFRRNEAVQEQLNVELKVVKSEGWQNYNAAINSLRDSILNNLGTFDLVATWSPRGPILAAEGLYQDLNSFEYFDASQEWWSQTMLSTLQVNNKLFLATGDISTTYMDEAFTVIFNSDIAAAQGYDYSVFYDVVEAKEWTIEYLSTLSKNAYSNLDGIPGRTGGDVYGLVVQETINLQSFWSGSEINIVPNNGVERPELTFNTEYIQNVYEAVRDLVVDNEGVVVNSISDHLLGSSNVDDALKYFAANKSLFFLSRLGQLAQLTSMETDYGLLPIPLYSSSQENYRTHIHACTMWSIPLDAKNSEMSSAVLTAMGYHSNRLVIDAHYDKLLKTRYVKDTESGYMIDLIYNNIYMNFDAVYNEALGNKSDKTTLPVFIFHSLLLNSDSSVASWYARNKGALESNFNAIIEGFYK